MLNDGCQTANWGLRTNGGGFPRPAFRIRYSAPRWVAAKRCCAFTLIETLLAASVTSLVAVAGVTMVFAATSAASGTRDVRTTKTAGHYALSRMAKKIREARVIGEVTATSVTLWLDDLNGDDTVNAGEVGYIEYDPIAKQILFETLDPASGISPGLVVSPSVLTDSAQLQLLVPDSAKSVVTWADGVEALTLTGYPSLTETRIVGVRFTIGVGADQVAFQTTASPRAPGDYLFVPQAIIPPNGPSGRVLRRFFSRWDGFGDIMGFTPL